MPSADVVIIGAGILGASVAHALARRGVKDLLVLEQEAVPNRHSSGRNASYHLPMYDTPAFSALAQASLPFFRSPPDGFDTPLLTPRGAVIAAMDADRGLLQAEVAEAREHGIAVQSVAPSDVSALVPIVRTDWFIEAAYYPEAGPIDVHALSMGYSAGAKNRGARFAFGQHVTAIHTRAGEAYAVETASNLISCGAVVNAAGAWAGMIGALAGAAFIPFDACRRHIVCVALPHEYAHGNWAFFRCPSLPVYFKPESGRLLASIMDADPDAPGDCMTDDMRVAETADRINEYTHLSIRHIESAWAGHRTFAGDGELVIGRDPAIQNFFWAAGLGGAGVMGSPEVGKLVARAVLGEATDGEAALMSPERWTTARQST
jgi:D-arginine dehydrogenase